VGGVLLSTIADSENMRPKTRQILVHFFSFDFWPPFGPPCIVSIPFALLYFTIGWGRGCGRNSKVVASPSKWYCPEG
jgi:hypothetical protein